MNKIHPQTLKIHHPYKAIPAFQALASILEQELGLHRVDRTRGRSQSNRARDLEAHQALESFSCWARRTIGNATEPDLIASWRCLHQELTRFGVRLVPRGNGLAVVDAQALDRRGCTGAWPTTLAKIQRDVGHLNVGSQPRESQEWTFWLFRLIKSTKTTTVLHQLRPGDGKSGWVHQDVA